jgi:hypothetical protein
MSALATSEYLLKMSSPKEESISFARTIIEVSLQAARD